MKTKYFLIYDPEEGFAERLAASLSRKDLDYRFRGFANREKLLEAVSDEPAQVVLTDLAGMTEEEQDSYMESLSEKSAGVVCFLPQQRTDRNWIYVNKYRSSAQIYREVMEQLRNSSSPAGDKVTAGLLSVGVFSPVGGCGKSRLAAAISEMLAKRGDTLLVCMETFAEQVDGASGDFADVAYYYRQGRLDEQVWKRLKTRVGAVDMIGPPLNPEDMEVLSRRELSEIWAALAGFGYDHLVIDAGGRFPAQEAALSFCDIVASPEYRRESGKWEHFFRYIRGTGRTDWEKKLWFVPELTLPELEEAWNRVQAR